MSDTQLDLELTTLRDENVRLRAVVAAADAWRQTLNLPQQDLGCAEFNEAFENYDDARSEVEDIMPIARCAEPGCDDLVLFAERCEDHQPEPDTAARKLSVVRRIHP